MWSFEGQNISALPNKGVQKTQFCAPSNCISIRVFWQCL